MITSAELEDFQSHRRNKLVFSPGVNAIVGETDSGKSAILRALSWVCNNRPTGEAFRSSWSEHDVAVEIKTPEGSVKRERGFREVQGTGTRKRREDFNGYVLNGEDLKAGSEVPEAVTEFLNLDSVNVQGQFDKHFLLADSSGEVARQLNRMANLDVIDTALSGATSRLRSVAGDLRAQEALLEQGIAALESFAYLPKLEEDLKAIKTTEGQAQEARGAEVKLKALLVEADAAFDVQATARRAVRAKGALEALEKAAQSSQQLRERSLALNRIAGEGGRLQGVLTESLRVMKARAPLEALGAKAEEAAALVKQSRELFVLVNHIRLLMKEIKEQEARIQDKRETLTREMPDVCPLCNQPVRKK